MPNVPPYGVFGRPNAAATPGVPTAMIEGVGALVGDPTARDINQVWAGDANGVPKLIWSKTAGSPDDATITYLTSAPDGPRVSVSWTPSSPLIADSYNVYRPDGSLAGNVAAPATSFVDQNPRPLNGAYSVRGVLSGSEGPATVSNSLNLLLTPTSVLASVNSGGTDAQTVTITWGHNALGRPDQYAVYEIVSGSPVLLGTVAGTVLTLDDPTPTAGGVRTYSVQAVLSTLPGGSANDDVNVPARPPTSVTLVATNPPLSNLRLTWSPPAAGSVTAYEVERSTNGTTWTDHTDDVSPSDWGTTVNGWMRVRATSPGGASAWVQRGPVLPINDVTPPPNATITSYRPETSYGRLVIRFTTPNVPDFAQYLVQRSATGGDPWTNVTGWVDAAPNTPIAVVVGTFAAGTNMRARVLVRDDATPTPNQNVGATQSYTLAATPIIVDPSGDLSGTYRGGAWRNDATRSTTEIATGWTSSGHNIGCFFYGTTIDAALGSKTIVSATIEYYRENEGGLSAAVQPLFWTHNLTGRTGAPVPDAEGVAEASRLGQGVVRSTPNDTGTFNLPAAFITALQANTAKGLCMYRGVVGSGDPDNFYALLGIGDVANNGVVNGRLRFNHLG